MTSLHPTLVVPSVYPNDWLSRFERKYASDPDYVAESLALDVTEEAVQLMEEQGLSRADLAARMNVSRAYVTQVLNARPNLTLRSVAQLAIALGARPSVHLRTEATQLQEASAQTATTWIPSTNSMTTFISYTNSMAATLVSTSPLVPNVPWWGGTELTTVGTIVFPAVAGAVSVAMPAAVGPLPPRRQSLQASRIESELALAA